MSIAQELIDRLFQGVKPVVQFKKKIEDQESCLDPNMKGRVVGYNDESEEGYTCLVFEIDLSEFEEYNEQFQVRNYYDKNGIPCLTAKEAGFYRNMETFYLSGDESDTDYVEISEKSRLYDQYLTEREPGQTYISYLENLNQGLSDQLERTKESYQFIYEQAQKLCH